VAVRDGKGGGVEWGKTAGGCLGGLTAGRPSRRTSPSLGALRPQRIRSSVVLPDPDGPTTARNSPRATSNETSSSAAGPCSANRLLSRETWRTSPSAAELTDRSVVPGEHPLLGAEEEPVQGVAEQAEEEDAGVQLRHVELGLLELDVVPQPVGRADELRDDHHHEADRERDAKAGDDRRERRGQVEAMHALEPAHLQQGARVAS